MAYASRTLTPAERNYHLHSGKLEFLAVSKRFRDYLYYAPHFTHYSDNSLLSYIMTTPRLDATRIRWISELADFHFTVKYKPGPLNKDADGLSRMSLNYEQLRTHFTEEADPEVIHSNINMAQVLARVGDMSAATCKLDYHKKPEGVPHVSKVYLAKAQDEDSAIFAVKTLVQCGSRPSDGKRKTMS